MPIRGLASIAAVLVCAACGGSGTPSTPSTPPTTTPPAATTPALTITFTDNPVPYKTTGCNGSTPQGWYTDARVQETAGVAFIPKTLTQKLDGVVADSLAESYASRFGACAGGMFDPALIPPKGAVCAVVGICSATQTASTYQLQISGTDLSGQVLTFTSPLLQLSPR